MCRFAPGPLNVPPTGSVSVDVYVYVRFNGGFTPADLIASYMVGWIVKEDVERHGKWHGEAVTWFDVLTNKISVDRSSVGNALYVVLNLAAGSASESAKSLKKNYADLEKWSSVAPSVVKRNVSVQQSLQPQYQQSMPNTMAQNTYALPNAQYQDQSFGNVSYGQSAPYGQSVGYQSQPVQGYYDPYAGMGYNQTQYQSQPQSMTYGQIPQQQQGGMYAGYPQQGVVPPSQSGYSMPQQQGQQQQSAYPPYYQQQ